MENEHIVRFLSSDIKRNSASSKREPIEIDLSNDDLDDELATFFRFINKVVNAHVKLHQEIRVWALKSAPP